MEEKQGREHVTVGGLFRHGADRKRNAAGGRRVSTIQKNR